MDCTTPGFPVFHYFPDLAQIHVHWVSDVIQPSSVSPFSSHLQSFPASGSFPVSQLFTSGGQSIRVSGSVSLLPMNIQGWFPLRLISLLSKGLLKSSATPQFKSINSLVLTLCHSPNLTSVHDYLKDHSFDCMDFVGKVMPLLFNMLSRFVMGEGNGTPLQYCCPENPMDGGAW